MLEAKKRNPDIFLDSLPWGAPGWIGDRKYYTQDMADYIAGFIIGTKKYIGLDIDYTGVWNEQPYETEWIKDLRKTLDRKGLESVKVVAADSNRRDWKIVRDVKSDPELRDSIYAIGDHYIAYNSSDQARKLGMPLWAAEDGPWRGDWKGARSLAMLYNRNYIDGRFTKTIMWSLITSYYDILPLPGSGIMRANEPWSGHFVDQPALWITAHTTQFADPGWCYVDSGCGYLKSGGSYVTLKKPGDSGDYSIIIETMDFPYYAKFFLQHVRFVLPKEFSDSPVQVWRSDEDEQFVHVQTIKPRNGVLNLKVSGNSVYSLTTTRGQQKGVFSARSSRPFPLPYADDFESYDEHTLPKYLSDQYGVFEVHDGPDGRGKCLKQVITTKGIDWPNNPSRLPETLLGDANWADYEVAADIMLPVEGFVSVIGRVSGQAFRKPADSYKFSITDKGQWKLTAKGAELVKGTTTFKPKTWYRFTMSFKGNHINVKIDDNEIVSVIDQTCTRGLAGLGGGLNEIWFDNFSVKPIH
jgi:galactosylceramidase